MAKPKKETATETSLASIDSSVPKPRLIKLTVKNFRCIGAKPVEIERDEIVVLVGANNVGKSSILKAYELAMSQGSDKAKLKKEDFPNRAHTVNNDGDAEVRNTTVVINHDTGGHDMLFSKTTVDGQTGETKHEEGGHGPNFKN